MNDNKISWYLENLPVGRPASSSIFPRQPKEEFGPFLNAQVDAGNLVNWGILSHNWGDEWNVNIYYGAESLDKFQTAFNEAINGFLEKNPDGMKQFEELCFEHKDNIYGRAYSYPATEEDN